MSFPQNTLSHTPNLTFNWIGIHKISMDEFSRKHSDSHPDFWMSFPGFADKGLISRREKYLLKTMGIWIENPYHYVIDAEFGADLEFEWHVTLYASQPLVVKISVENFETLIARRYQTLCWRGLIFYMYALFCPFFQIEGSFLTGAHIWYNGNNLET